MKRKNFLTVFILFFAVFAAGMAYGAAEKPKCSDDSWEKIAAKYDAQIEDVDNEECVALIRLVPGGRGGTHSDDDLDDYDIGGLVEGVYRLIDSYGTTLSDDYYDCYPRKVSRGTVICEDNGSWYLVNKNGRVGGPFDKVVGDFDKGVTAVLSQGGWFLVNYKGGRISDVFDDIGNFEIQKGKNGEKIIAKVKKNFRYNYLAISEKKETYAVEFLLQSWVDYGKDFSDSVVRVKKNGYWFFINADGKEIGGPFEKTGSFRNGKAYIRNNGEEMYLLESGKIIKKSASIERIGGCNNNACSAKGTDGKEILINADGKILESGYESVEFFPNSEIIEVRNEGETHLMDSKSGAILQKCDYVNSYGDGRFDCKINEKTYSFTMTENTLIPLPDSNDNSETGSVIDKTNSENK